MQRLAQPLGIDAQRLPEPQAFIVRRHAGPQDEVVHHLADLPRARRPQMEDVRRECTENGSAALEGIGVARAVDEELARRRSRFPARERDVEENELSLGKARSEPLRIARRNRRAERDDKARPRALEHAVLAEDDFFDLAVETDHDDDELARLRELARRSCAARPPCGRLLPH